MTEAYPLQWSLGWPRTRKPDTARFSTPMGAARDGLLEELRLMNATNADNRIIHDGLDRDRAISAIESALAAAQPRKATEGSLTLSKQIISEVVLFVTFEKLGDAWVVKIPHTYGKGEHYIAPMSEKLSLQFQPDLTILDDAERKLFNALLEIDGEDEPEIKGNTHLNAAISGKDGDE